MDESYLLSAARYIELNPVRAKLVREPAAYPWSSAGAHVEGQEDKLIVASPLSEMIDDWREFLNNGIGVNDIEILRLHERTGRPLGNDNFITRLESELARVLHRRKPGPKGTPKRN